MQTNNSYRGLKQSEKKNQKSTQTIGTLQKKLENYHKRMSVLDTYGMTGHKQATEVLRDKGQGLK